MAMGPAPDRSDLASAPKSHRLPVRVYYIEDTDFSGFVYHASYLRFLERGRTEFLRALGIEHSGIFASGGADGLHFVVRAMSVEFLKPALMDDVLTVKTCVSGIGGASIEMVQQIRRRQELLLAAKVRIAIVAGARQSVSPKTYWRSLERKRQRGRRLKLAQNRYFNRNLTLIETNCRTTSVLFALAF
jgi:acyl-CoA thioester hydrolase